MERSREESSHKGKKKGVLIVIIVIAIVAVIVGGYFIYQNIHPKSDFMFDKMAQDGFLEGKSQAEIQDILDQVVAEGMFNVCINSNPVFENGQAEGNLRIENVPNNKYYMKVDVILNDTGEVIYQSNGIKQGQFIEKVKLSKDLPAGEYKATARFTAVNPQSMKEEGAAAVELLITVLN